MFSQLFTNLSARTKRTAPKAQLRIEVLEDRFAPATLTITPPRVVDPEYDLIVRVADQGQPGLTQAEARTDGVVAWSLAASPALAQTGEASPFAGFYCTRDLVGGGASVTISKSGAIDGVIQFGSIADGQLYFVEQNLKGTISDDGFIQLRVDEKWYLGTTRQKSPDFHFRYTLTGDGTLDQFDSLFGVLRDENGSITEFYWPRCQTKK